MPTREDLVGLGMPAQLASLLGNTPQLLTTTGTAQATAATILAHLSVLTAASSQTGAILPSGATLGTPFWAFNNSATSAVIYCPVGHTLNGTVNNSLTVAQNKMAVLMRITGNSWGTILTA